MCPKNLYANTYKRERIDHTYRIRDTTSALRTMASTNGPLRSCREGVVVKYIPNKILYKKNPGKKYKTNHEKIMIWNK